MLIVHACAYTGTLPLELASFPGYTCAYTDDALIAHAYACAYAEHYQSSFTDVKRRVYETLHVNKMADSSPVRAARDRNSVIRDIRQNFTIFKVWSMLRKVRWYPSLVWKSYTVGENE